VLSFHTLAASAAAFGGAGGVGSNLIFSNKVANTLQQARYFPPSLGSHSVPRKAKQFPQPPFSAVLWVQSVNFVSDMLGFMGGILFSMTVILTPSMGHYLYPKMLKLLEQYGKPAGSLSRGIIAALLWVMPVALGVVLLILLHNLARSVLPTFDPHHFRRVMVWGMGLGLIGGLLIARHVAMSYKTKDGAL
jgi:hypothetical protein